MKILVTGGAGFIGAHTTKALLDRGHEILGIDNFSDYYSPEYKQERVRNLLEGTQIEELDITNKEALKKVFAKEKIDRVCHLAAQPGVRYSLENPHIYEETNIQGTLNILEACRQNNIEHVIYASSSSVYGGNTTFPFSESDPLAGPVSLYGATKAATEHLAHSYHKSFGIKTMGLRFFTVYGPWGRPDMAYLIFAKKMLKGKPIDVYGEGQMKRDFTYIDDIVSGTVAAIEADFENDIINLGNSNTVELEKFIEILENELGVEAKKEYKPLQPGDPKETFANIEHAKEVLGWQPQISIEEGLAKFVKWLRENENLLKKLKLL